ncbi:MAG: hypothetical protein IT213_08720 [Cytophagales bacterium]|nr:hypothetical protein [Cytophagales bacterium]
MKGKEMDDISSLWQQAKASSQAQPKSSIAGLMQAAEARKKNALSAHFGNAAILLVTVAILVFYFYYLYYFEDVLSKVGYNVMIGGLVIRIMIEGYSVWRSRKVKISDTVRESVQNSISFLKFRKYVHGPVTLFILVTYFIGFYLLTPEFNRYFSTFWMIMIDISAFVAAIILTYYIRKGIKQEIQDLEKIVEIQSHLLSSE